MLFVTLSMFFLALIILSLEESNGNPAENGIISLIFFAQFSSYLLYRINPHTRLERNRIQFSIQIIAAAYVLSGISKLWIGGINWFMADAPKFALEVMRVYYTKYTATGVVQYRERGVAVSDFVSSHLTFMRCILLTTLFIELGACVMLFGKKYAFVYAFLLLAMHWSIYLMMDITFPTIMLPMMVVAINPVYLLIIFLQKTRNAVNYS